MKHKEMDWKAWLALIIIVIIIGGITSGMQARAESTTSADQAMVNDKENHHLDKAESEGVSTDEPVDIPADSPSAAETSTPSPENEATDTPDASGTPTTDDTITNPTEAPNPPADKPTLQPTAAPTIEPTVEPTTEPTEMPTEHPAETPDLPAETEQPPVDVKTLFNVNIKAPSGWRNSYSATVRVKIIPTSSQMWHKVYYRINDEEWIVIKNNELVLYEGYYYTDIEVYFNAKMTVRMYVNEETYFDTSTEVLTFDHYAPEVTAGFRDQVLHVEAVDDLAQVAGIQVNGLLFTTLVDGKLDVRMEEPLLSYKQLAIRAYDYAGNFSDPVTLDNPYYVDPTPEPTNTPKPTNKPTTKPTKKPSSGTSGNKKPTATPVVTATPAPTAVTPPQQIVYVTPDSNMYSYYQPQVTAEPETVYVPLGPGQPYKGEGNMQTMDVLYSASTNKQFITVQTRAGETYYMVIDYDKPIDEANDIYETYFLNLVDDRDLMSVVSEDEIQPTPTPQIVYVTPEPAPATQQPAPIVVEDDSMEEMLPTVLLIGGVAAIGGAIFWLVKKKKDSSARNVPDFDDEYEFEGEEDDEDR